VVNKSLLCGVCVCRHGSLLLHEPASSFLHVCLCELQVFRPIVLEDFQASSPI
jgi:hypothetical protein